MDEPIAVDIKELSEQIDRALAAAPDAADRVLLIRQLQTDVTALSHRLGETYRQSILDMKAEGMSNSAITQTLGISYHRLHLLMSKARESQNGNQPETGE